MKTTCLINNYNYAQYVGEAVDGALRQTVPLDEIIVVDDGSKDGSVELLTSRYGRHPVVKLVSKRNQGQLSCFNEGFAHATGDIVFFLDADDVYEPDYVETALAVYRHDTSCDFLFCGRRNFGLQDRTVLAFPEDRDLGYSLIQTAIARSWIGAATSCLSMRRALLQKILPLPFVDEWRFHADDCLVFGASLAGGRKRFLAEPLVRYRVHGTNHHLHRNKDPYGIYRRRLAINRLFEHFQRSLCFDTGRLPEIAHREFLTLDKPSVRQLRLYNRISMSGRIPIVQRFGYVAEMILHFFKTRGQRPDGALSVSRSTDRQRGFPLRLLEGQNALDGRDVAHLPRRDAHVA
jgi:glycosyltransferase involved in cell wall biosynthesis